MLFDSYAPKCVTQILEFKFAGEHYERHSRLTPASMAKTLNQAGFRVNRIVFLGFPPFKPWMCGASDEKPPWFAYLWTAFDRLTKRKPLVMLKEVMVFEAVLRARVA